jgi:hypothetical protein
MMQVPNGYKREGMSPMLTECILYFLLKFELFLNNTRVVFYENKYSLLLLLFTLSRSEAEVRQRTIIVVYLHTQIPPFKNKVN